MKEIWKPVVGYKNHYEVSNIGNIKSLSRTIFYVMNGKRMSRVVKEKKLKIQHNTYGYPTIVLSKNKVHTNHFVHRLVARAFLGKGRGVVNHINGNHKDNRVKNLEYCSIRENATHSTLMKGNTIGVSFKKRSPKKPYYATVSIGKRSIYCGRFATLDEASAAYRAALKELGIRNKYVS